MKTSIGQNKLILKHDFRKLIAFLRIYYSDQLTFRFVYSYRKLRMCEKNQDFLKHLRDT